MNASEIIDLVRQEVNDTIEDYRFDNPEMISALNDANRELSQDRPDLLLNADGTYKTLVAIVDLSDTILFDDDQRQALMHYTCYRILSKDSEDDQNLALSLNHLSQYRERI